MQNIFSGKVFNVFKFICANGAGETGGGTSTALMSGLMTVLAGLLDLLSSLVSWLWGLVMTLLYNVVKLVLNIVDVLEFFVTKLVGIDIYKTPGWSNTTSLKDSDMIIKLITSDTVLNLFGKICIIAGLLLMIFCIFSIVRENYKIAMGDEVKGNPATNALKKALKSIFLCFLVPFLLIVGILGSNVILASVCAAIRGNNDLTVGGVIFTTSAYEANRYRLYASEGKRTPIYYSAASEIVNPSDYTETNDMMILFYDLVVGNTYIGSLSPEIQQNIDQGFYDDWYDDIKNLGLEAVNEDDYNDGSFLDGLGSIGETLVEVAGRTFLGSVWHSLNGVIDKINGGVVAGADDSSASAKFSQAFATWYEDKFDSVPLDDLGMWNKHIRSIYNTNWSKNDDLSTSQVEFKSTYVKNSNNPLNFPSNGDVANVFVYTNSDSYSDYETFTTMEVEYYVMADVIDYAIEHNQKFYFINADSDKIQWTPMDYKNSDDGEPDADKTIDTYNANACVFSYEDSTGKVNYLVADKDQLEDAGIKIDGGDYFVNNGSTPAAKLSSDSFYVSYSDGGGGSINRLYWSEDGTLGERYGSTYIVCIAEVKEDGTETGKYLPVTQKTTNFRSSFLADDYAGPIVARGAFSSWGIVALGSKQYPTGLREQLVDADGTPIKTFESYNKNNSSYSLTPVVSTDKAGNLLANANYFYKASTFIDKLDTDSVDRVAEAVAGSTGIKGQLSDSIYYNSYISYYKMLDTNTVEFYDASGSRMKLSSDSTGDDTSKISAATTDVNFDYFMNPELLHNYYVKGELDDGDIDKLIAGSLADSGVIKESDLIKIKYTGTLVTFEYNGTSISMLVDVKATGIVQNGTEATSGTFYTFSLYKNVENDNFIDAVTGGVVIETAGDNQKQVAIYHKEPVNLYIKNGEVYNATGTAFVTKTTASELKDSLVSSVKTITNEDIVNYLYAEGSGDQKKLLSSVEISSGSLIKIDNIYTLVGNEKYRYEKRGLNFIKQKNVEDVWVDLSTGDFYSDSSFSTQMADSDFKEDADEVIKNTKTVYFVSSDNDEQKIQARTVIASNGSCIDGDVQTARQSLIQELYKSIAIKYYGKSGGRVAISFGSTISELPSSRYVVSEEGTSPNIKYTITYKTSKGDINKTFKTAEGVSNRVLGATTGKDIPAYLGYDGDDGKWTNVKLYLTDPTTTGLATKKVDVTITASVSYDLYKNSSDSMAINFALDSVDFNTSDDAKKYIKVQANAITCNGTVALSKTTITQLVAQGLNNTNIETQDDEGKTITFKNVDFLSALSLATYPTDTDRYVYFEYGSFGVLFSNIVLDFAFHLDLSNITSGFKIFAFRLRLGVVKSYQIKTSYHLENGGFILDYNFNRTRGIGITYLFDMKHINPLVLIFSTAIVFNMLWKMVWGLISRIYEIAIQFIILPGVLAVEVITPGKFSDWSGNVIKKVMVAYSSLIMINLYYALIPSISSLTDGLISWDDLPSTITSMFGAIGNSISSIGGGKMLGNINVNFTNIISKVTEIFEDGYAGKTIAAFLNKIIFILFFLVLTTLTSKGKDLIGDYINSGDVVADGASTLGDVNKLKQDFKNNPVNKMVGAGVGLAKKGVAKHMAKKAGIGGGGRSDFTADDLVEREVEETGDDIATAPARVSGSAEMTSLASALSGSGTSINLNFAPAVMGQRHRGEGVPLPPVTPQDDADDSSNSSSHSSVMNGSGGFGYGGDEGSSRPTHGSGTAYFGGGGSSRGGVAYFDASQSVDPNMNIDELKSYWDKLKKQEQAQLKAAKDLMKEARAEYTDEDKAEHARVKKERVELSDSFSSEPTAENFVAFSKVADRDDELTAKQRRSQELREQAKEQREQYNNTKAEREAYQAAIGRKVAAGTVTSEQLFALSEDQRDKSINPDLTNDEIAQKEQEYTDKAEESKKRKSKAEEDYQLNVEVQKEQEERLRASQDAIADHKKTIAELNMHIDELKAKKNDPNATEEDKANAEKLIGIDQTAIGQEWQYINGEILKAQEAKKAIGESKNAQQDALYEKSSADKDLNANTEEALKYAMEKERRENLEKNATMGDLEALKAEINKRADAEKTGVLIDETRKGLDAIAGQVDKKADIFSVDRNADVTKQAIEQLNQEKADSKAVADKLKEKADAAKVASALNSMGAGGDGSGGGAGGSGGSGGKVKKPRKTLDEKKRELINKQLDLEEEEIKPGLFSWAKRAKNSVKRTKLRLQIGAISTAQATGDGIQKGVNFAGKWTLGKIQKGADFVKNTSVGRAVTKAGTAVGHVAQVVASAPGQVIDKVKDKVDNSNYMQNERQRIANRQQHYADQHTEQISTAEERVRNNQSRRYYSQEYAEEIERRQNARQQSNGSGNGNRTSTGNGSGSGNRTSTGNGSGNGNRTSTGNGSGNGNRNSTGNGSGNGNSTSTGNGSGNGNRTSTGNGSGNGNRNSTGNGSGNGNRTSTGNGSGGSGTQNQTNNQTQNQNQAQTQTQNEATTSQTATSQTASTNNPAQNTKLTKGQVAGRVIGGVVGGVAGYAIVASFQNKKMKKKNAQTSADSSTETLTATPTATSESAKPTKAERKAQQATLKAEEEARKVAEREAKRAETERLQREKEEQIVERERQELLAAAKQREREAAIRAQERKDKLRRKKR